MHAVYILQCADGTLYTGYSANLHARIEHHQRGRGAHYTKTRRPVVLVYHEVYTTKSEAMRREYAIKQLRRDEKLALIALARVTMDSMP